MTESFKQWTKEDIRTFVKKNGLHKNFVEQLDKYCGMACGVNISFQKMCIPEDKEPECTGLVTVQMKTYAVEEDD